eukprot:3443058-Prymnesium_polylepis.1
MGIVLQISHKNPVSRPTTARGARPHRPRRRAARSCRLRPSSPASANSLQGGIGRRRPCAGCRPRSGEAGDWIDKDGDAVVSDVGDDAAADVAQRP